MPSEQCIRKGEKGSNCSCNVWFSYWRNSANLTCLWVYIKPKDATHLMIFLLIGWLATAQPLVKFMSVKPKDATHLMIFLLIGWLATVQQLVKRRNNDEYTRQMLTPSWGEPECNVYMCDWMQRMIYKVCQLIIIVHSYCIIIYSIESILYICWYW